MVLTDKERFILHFAQNMMTLSEIDVEPFVTHVLKHRCRKLDLEKVKEIVKEMQEEQIFSKSMWEEP